MTNRITVHFTAPEMDLLISNLDGLIYSLGFDQDEDLITLYDKLFDLREGFSKTSE